MRKECWIILGLGIVGVVATILIMRSKKCSCNSTSTQVAEAVEDENGDTVLVDENLNIVARGSVNSNEEPMTKGSCYCKQDDGTWVSCKCPS